MNKLKKKKNYLLFFIIFLTSFLLGVSFSFIIGQKTTLEMLKNNNKSDLISILSQDDLDLTKFWEVYSLIKAHNYGSDGINKEDLVNSAIKGLVEGLGDKHSEYMTKEETSKFNQALSGDFEGIGAVVEKNPMGVFIDRIIKGSPAKKFGLRLGDIITKANGEKLADLDLFDSVNKIKGPAGTKVLLEVIRAGERNVLEIEVIRDKIKIPSVDSRLLEDGETAYIALNMFGDDTSFEFENALRKYMNTKGIIIDLRDNGGGYLQSAVAILSNLVEDDKTLVVTKYKELFSNIAYPSINNGNIYSGKIVILINENSASASEITAGTLRDYKKAILVGKKSYGKGSVQKPFRLSDGSMVKLTIAKWFTPEDINIDKEGIEPDIKVDFEKQDYTPEPGKEEEFELYDRQLEEAKKVLKTFIENGAYKLSIEKYKSSN